MQDPQPSNDKAIELFELLSSGILTKEDGVEQLMAAGHSAARLKDELLPLHSKRGQPNLYIGGIWRLMDKNMSDKAIHHKSFRLGVEVHWAKARTGDEEGESVAFCCGLQVRKNAKPKESQQESIRALVHLASFVFRSLFMFNTPGESSHVEWIKFSMEENLFCKPKEKFVCDIVYNGLCGIMACFASRLAYFTSFLRISALLHLDCYYTQGSHLPFRTCKDYIDQLRIGVPRYRRREIQIPILLTLPKLRVLEVDCVNSNDCSNSRQEWDKMLALLAVNTFLTSYSVKYLWDRSTYSNYPWNYRNENLLSFPSTMDPRIRKVAQLATITNQVSKEDAATALYSWLQLGGVEAIVAARREQDKDYMLVSPPRKRARSLAEHVNDALTRFPHLVRKFVKRVKRRK